MPERDFYSILGITRSATQEQIKSAYRKLARSFHPDMNKDPDAAARFAEVQEAYEVLHDPAKREQYDRFGRVGIAGAAGRGGPRGAGPDPHFSWSNIAGADPFGEDDLGSAFESFFGARGQGFSGGTKRPRRGADLRHVIDVDFMLAAHGGTHELVVSRGDERRRISVRVPPAVAEGTKLRVRGEGEPGAGRGAMPGDLIVTVHVRPHEIFRRGSGRAGEPADTLDLSFELPITMAEAALGAEIRVPTLAGPVSLTVPPGTSGGARLRLGGRGLRRDPKRVGDLYAIVRVTAPKPVDLPESLRASLEAWRDSGIPSPRRGPGWPEA